MSGYARGTHAWGECQRCGFRVPYLSMMDDGHVPGLRVCTTCYDPHHPQDDPPRIEADAQGLYKPAPELSIPEGEGEAAPTLESFLD